MLAAEVRADWAAEAERLLGVALTNAADLAACAAAAAAEAKAAVTTRSPPFCAAEEVAGGLLEGR